jgi:hypothetical protein
LIEETKLAGWRGAVERECCHEYIVPGDIYRDPEMDLQLPQSHLAFRIPGGFSGAAQRERSIQDFPADRKLSCFLFVHGAGTKLPTNWMSASFALDGETLVAVGEQKQNEQLSNVYLTPIPADLGQGLLASR